LATSDGDLIHRMYEVNSKDQTKYMR